MKNEDIKGKAKKERKKERKKEIFERRKLKGKLSIL